MTKNIEENRKGVKKRRKKKKKKTERPGLGFEPRHLEFLRLMPTPFNVGGADCSA